MNTTTQPTTTPPSQKAMECAKEIESLNYPPGLAIHNIGFIIDRHYPSALIVRSGVTPVYHVPPEHMNVTPPAPVAPAAHSPDCDAIDVNCEGIRKPCNCKPAAATTGTPRTDAEAEYTGANIDQVAAITALARTLERELAALREDKERLDFLNSLRADDILNNPTMNFIWGTGDPLEGGGRTSHLDLRGAIDAARASATEGGK